MPVVQTVQLAAPAAEKEFAAHGAGAAPLAHAEPAGHEPAV